MKHSRTDRLDSEYQKEISKIISGALKDREPEIKGIVSVTEAHVAPDLKTAKIFISVFAVDSEQKNKTFSVIRDNAGFIRRELARVMNTRRSRAYLSARREHGIRLEDGRAVHKTA